MRYVLGFDKFWIARAYDKEGILTLEITSNKEEALIFTVLRNAQLLRRRIRKLLGVKYKIQKI